ncbi:MAG: DUF1501 domain-containing protein [Gemmataceae bacterium]
MLAHCSNGFGAVALAALLAEEQAHGTAPPRVRTHAGVHHRATARSIIFLYMDGGVSQVDSFDPKPMLSKHNGSEPHKLFKVEPTQFNSIGRVLASPWKFNQYGESGLPISSLFPHLAQHADKLAVIRSMTSKFSEHTSANYFLHTGSGLQGRPSMGAWLSYGLGRLNHNLPSFVVLNGGLIPPGGLDNFNSGFLPAAHQGSVFKASANPLANIRRLERDEASQKRKLDLVRQLDRLNPHHDEAIEAAIANHETAFRMQTAVPELMDISGESKATQQMYGLESSYGPTRTYGRQCLIARRLVERGVRFIELTCPHVGHDRWDQHNNLKKGHEDNARAVDQPIAALLSDLASRGLLDSTLVVFSGEFGRTPFAQGSDGRDHNPYGFSLWMAGGGIRGGMTYGATDEWGYKAIENKLDMHDLHATMLHTLGIDHKKLTVRFGGRDMRLTDVHGEVVRAILS